MLQCHDSLFPYMELKDELLTFVPSYAIFSINPLS